MESDSEEKESIEKYADQESKEEWGALKAFNEGHTWNEFKKELLDNYPEASVAERGMPARIWQIVWEADNVELGDTVKLYSYWQAFLAEANKLMKPPVVMSNRELVELFMGGLSSTMGQAVLQFLGGSAKKKVAKKEKEAKVKDLRRPKDWHDLDEVCQAAGEVSENAQGMLLYKWGSTSQGPKRGSSLVQVTGDSSMLVSKIESIEEHQALEKNCLDVVNKQWGAKLEAIEGLIKMLLSQAQEKLSLAFVQNMGMGYRSGNNSELLGRPLKNFPSGIELICFRCRESGHF